MCQMLQLLTYISVNNNALWGTLPSPWSAMSHLQYINMASNAFNGSIPGDYSNWTLVSPPLMCSIKVHKDAEAFVPGSHNVTQHCKDSVQLTD